MSNTHKALALSPAVAHNTIVIAHSSNKTRWP
jgi:hypothetical protein